MKREKWNPGYSKYPGQPNESDKIESGSQEEILKEVMTTLNGDHPWIVMEEHFQNTLSKFYLTRKTQ